MFLPGHQLLNVVKGRMLVSEMVFIFLLISLKRCAYD